MTFLHLAPTTRTSCPQQKQNNNGKGHYGALFVGRTSQRGGTTNAVACEQFGHTYFSLFNPAPSRPQSTWGLGDAIQPRSGWWKPPPPKRTRSGIGLGGEPLSSPFQPSQNRSEPMDWGSRSGSEKNPPKTTEPDKPSPLKLRVSPRCRGPVGHMCLWCRFHNLHQHISSGEMFVSEVQGSIKHLVIAQNSHLDDGYETITASTRGKSSTEHKTDRANCPTYAMLTIEQSPPNFTYILWSHDITTGKLLASCPNGFGKQGHRS